MFDESVDGVITGSLRIIGAKKKKTLRLASQLKYIA